MKSTDELRLLNKMVKIENLKEKVSLQFKEVLIDKLKKAKNEYPIEAIRWRQYTPFFNDGSPCVFEVMDLELLLKKENIEYFAIASGDAYLDEGPNDLYYLPFYNLDLKKLPILKQLDKFFREIEPEYFRRAFDDHVEITFDGNEFDIQEYEHE